MEMPGLKRWLEELITTSISCFLVLPEKLIFPFGNWYCLSPIALEVYTVLMTVKIVSASNLGNEMFSRKPHPYCTLKIVNRISKKDTRIKSEVTETKLMESKDIEENKEAKGELLNEEEKLEATIRTSYKSGNRVEWDEEFDILLQDISISELLVNVLNYDVLNNGNKCFFLREKKLTPKKKKREREMRYCKKEFFFPKDLFGGI